MLRLVGGASGELGLGEGLGPTNGFGEGRRRGKREESKSHGVTLMSRHQLKVILTSFDIFNIISYDNNLSEL